MPKINMSQKALEALNFNGKRDDFYDVSCRGLALRISARSKTWVFSGKAHGRSMRLTLGSYPALTLKDARAKADQVRSSVRAGEDPVALRREAKAAAAAKRVQTFEAVTAEYLFMRKRHLSKRTIEGYQKIFASPRLRSWQSRPVSSIRNSDLLAITDRLEADGRYASAGAFVRALKAFFNWAEPRYHLDNNPCLGIKLQKSIEDLMRERWLTLDELSAIWRAADHALPLVSATYTKFLMLSALRREETAQIRWSWLDLNDVAPTLTIPVKFTKNKKRKTDFVVPLTKPMVGLIKGLPRHATTDFVFTSDGVTNISGHSKNKVAIEAALEKPIDDFRLHDFRRSFSTIANEELFESSAIIEMCLNHTSNKSTVEKTYNKATLMKKRRKLMEAWSDAVLAAVDGKSEPSNVVALGAA